MGSGGPPVPRGEHAAINNLLNRAWACAQQAGLAAAAAAVRAADDLLPGIRVLNKPEDLDAEQTPLAGGTAWLFCRPEQAGRWDYLFIDEASQVSLADVVAAGAAARNIVLLGDQLQLPQPVEGSHPGDSGLSVLDYQMQGQATVPPEHGIFLEKSYRMHPDVCRPVSEGVYEGRLSAADACSRQQLLLAPGADAALRPSGVYCVPVVHQHCRQSSLPEAQRCWRRCKSATIRWRGGGFVGGGRRRLTWAEADRAPRGALLLSAAPSARRPTASAVQNGASGSNSGGAPSGTS